MKTIKERLADELIKEREQFRARGQSVQDHDLAINYLLSGEINKNPDDWDLLDAVINDFEGVCSDYGVKE